MRSVQVLRAYRTHLTLHGWAGRGCAPVLVTLCASWLISGCAPSASDSEVALIVHADDAGLCRSVNAATIEALECGIVTSASVMVPAPAFEEFAAYVREHPEKDIGVHLVLNSEWKSIRWGPVAGKDQVPSLVDPDGFFWREPDDTYARATSRDVEVEMRAQIELAKQRGIRVSHLDSHMLTLFGRPDFIEIYSRLARELGIPAAIAGQSISMGKGLPPQREMAFKQAVQQMQAAQLPILDFIDFSSYRVDPAQKPNYFLSMLRTLKSGRSQIVIHCGNDDEELRAITPNARRRAADKEFFMSEVCSQEIKKLGITMTNWQILTSAETTE